MLTIVTGFRGIFNIQQELMTVTENNLVCVGGDPGLFAEAKEDKPEGFGWSGLHHDV